MSDKVNEIATRIGMLHGDCRGSSSEAFGATVENMLRKELRSIMNAARDVVDVHAEKHPTSCVKRLAIHLENWL